MQRVRDPAAIAAARAAQQAQFVLRHDEEDEQLWPNGTKKYAKMWTLPTAAMQYSDHRVKVDDEGLVLTGLLRTMGLDVPARQRGSGWGAAGSAAEWSATGWRDAGSAAEWSWSAQSWSWSWGTEPDPMELEAAPFEPKEESRPSPEPEPAAPLENKTVQPKEEQRSPTEEFTPAPSPITPEEDPITEDPYEPAPKPPSPQPKMHPVQYMGHTGKWVQR